MLRDAEAVVRRTTTPWSCQYLVGKFRGYPAVNQYLNKFNHLSQYAIDQVNTDLKKKNCFMRGLNDRLQRKMATCIDLTYGKVVPKHAPKAEEKPAEVKAEAAAPAEEKPVEEKAAPPVSK